MTKTRLDKAFENVEGIFASANINPDKCEMLEITADTWKSIQPEFDGFSSDTVEAALEKFGCEPKKIVSIFTKREHNCYELPVRKSIWGWDKAYLSTKIFRIHKGWVWAERVYGECTDMPFALNYIGNNGRHYAKCYFPHLYDVTEFICENYGKDFFDHEIADEFKTAKCYKQNRKKPLLRENDEIEEWEEEILDEMIREEYVEHELFEYRGNKVVIKWWVNKEIKRPFAVECAGKWWCFNEPDEAMEYIKEEFGLELDTDAIMNILSEKYVDGILE